MAETNYYGVQPNNVRDVENRYRYTANASQTAFPANYAIGYVDVYYGGVKLDPGTAFSAVNGTSVTLSNPATAGVTVEIISRRQVPVTTGVALPSVATSSYTATAGQTVFTLSSGVYTPGSGSLVVYMNGLKLRTGVDYLESSTTTFTLVSGAALGDEIDCIVGTLVSPNNGFNSGLAPVMELYTATAGQTAFSTVNAYTPAINTLDVYVNGISYNLGVDYVETSSNLVTFTTGLSLGDEVKFKIWRTSLTSGSDASIVTYSPATGSPTTVQSQLRAITAPTGSSLVGWLRGLLNAVATTIANWIGWQDVCVFEFMTAAQIADVQAGTKLQDVTVAIQNAITAAWKAGKRLYCPSGVYLISASLQIPPGSGYEYRADSFTIYGDGASNGFLGYSLGHGTTFVTVTDVPIIYYTNYSANGNNIFIDKIRFQQDNAAALSDVLYFDIFMAASKITNCQVYQGGIGHGIHIAYAYQGTISDTYVMNKDLVNSGSGVTRIGTAIKIDNTGSGGLLCFKQVTTRGFLRGWNFVSGVGQNISARMEQCECSTMTYGISIGTSMNKLVVTNCYFEAIYSNCITDTGNATVVENCWFFEGYAYGISSITNSYGNRYVGNVFQLNTATSTAIALQSDGDATGAGKVCSENFIYFLGSGGSLVSVLGILISGTNPNLSIKDNVFRPRRAWVGGVNTTQIQDNSTGYLVGSRPIADAYSQFPVYSNIGLSLAYTGNTLTSANVSGGVLTLPVDSRFDMTLSTAGSITSFALATGVSRIVVLNINAANVAVLTKGTYMLLSANWPTLTAGSLMLDIRVVGGSTYAYELARTLY